MNKSYHYIFVWFLAVIAMSSVCVSCAEDCETVENSVSQGELIQMFLAENERDAIAFSDAGLLETGEYEIADEQIAQVIGGLNMYFLLSVDDVPVVFQSPYTSAFPVIKEGAKINIHSVPTTLIPERFTKLRVEGISWNFEGEPSGETIYDYASTEVGQLYDYGNCNFTITLFPNNSGKDRTIIVHLITTEKFPYDHDPFSEGGYHKFTVRFRQLK